MNALVLNRGDPRVKMPVIVTSLSLIRWTGQSNDARNHSQTVGKAAAEELREWLTSQQQSGNLRNAHKVL